MTTETCDFDVLIARALNSAKSLHAPTYAALRLLLNSSERFLPVVQSFASRRCLNRKQWRYHPFPILKEVLDGKAPQYRNCFVGSPLTTIAETLVLKQMANEPVFRVPDCAFSYLWPKNKLGGRNFAYFFDGYRQRNVLASELIGRHGGQAAVILDIKSYYPNINREKLHNKIADRVSQISNPNVRRSVSQFLGSYLSVDLFGERGIPIGPELSHVLGHIALDEVDLAMVGEYGEGYLRYVDDLIIVVPVEESKKVVQFVGSVLGREGLELNETKGDCISSAIWANENPLGARSLPDSFDLLFDVITLYLMTYDKNWESLQATFRNEGFSIPIRQLRSRSRSSRFRAYFRRKVGNWRWYGSWIFLKEQDLVECAKEVRAEYLANAAILCSESIPPTPMRRRWYVQKRRYLLNRLLYLLSKNDYNQLEALIPPIDEFFELRVVVQALRTGDLTGVLSYPGRLVNSICQLWPEQGTNASPRLTWPIEPGVAEADSAASLAIGLSLFPPPQFLMELGESHPVGKQLLDFCTCEEARERSSEAGSYMDEVSDLNAELKHQEVVELVSTRYDELEDVGLEALNLGDTVSEFFSDAKDFKA